MNVAFAELCSLQVQWDGDLLRLLLSPCLQALCSGSVAIPSFNSSPHWCRCSGVVVCRASPAQKATIVRMMKRYRAEQVQVRGLLPTST